MYVVRVFVGNAHVPISCSLLLNNWFTWLGSCSNQSLHSSCLISSFSFPKCRPRRQQSSVLKRSTLYCRLPPSSKLSIRDGCGVQFHFVGITLSCMFNLGLALPHVLPTASSTSLLNLYAQH